MIMTDGLVWNVPSLAREIIGGGKLRRPVNIANGKIFNMPIGAVALFL